MTLLPSGAIRQKPLLVVSRKSFVAGSMSSVFTYGGFLEKSTRRGEGALAGAAGVGVSSPPQPAASTSAAGRASARPHDVPACASSHSASVVKPIMIPSIQYCERTANRG